ncbi:MAG: prepilin-type N-terminal cleavage/methylation domain-containing protein [Candidatus Omnitrophica bacterium]|nr:prepilin-type N-terminal cleavage/methylation domain-containing protein [Candidatus Omnitrophota bacterium]
MRDQCQGWSLFEMMVTLAIFTVLVAGVLGALAAGRSSWAKTDANIRVRENLRMAVNKMAAELRQCGADGSNVVQATINTGTGIGGSDIIRFSIPILCQTGMNVMDANGNVAAWGAPLTWGCLSSTCMDADNNCNTRDYQFIEYRLATSAYAGTGTLLVRRVLAGNAGATIVREDVIASQMLQLQIQWLNSGKGVIVTVGGSVLANNGRVITDTESMSIRFRNLR